MTDARISGGEATAGTVATTATLDAAGTAGTGYHPTAIEPGGIEAIPDEHRHGSPWQLLFTWSAPNFEFATVFVGMIAVAHFGLDFGQAVIAIVIGNVLGGIAHGLLSTWGPREGLSPLVLGRAAFGLRGNVVCAATWSRPSSRRLWPSSMVLSAGRLSLRRAWTPWTRKTRTQISLNAADRADRRNHPRRASALDGARRKSQSDKVKLEERT